MKIVFSRKGFDSATGGAPSPIVDGRTVSLPIPTERRSKTTYADLGLGEAVESASAGRILAKSMCHNDPMFEAGACALGQVGAAQGHLQNNGVGVGDVFLFFGLYSDARGRDRHHRIFGFLRVEQVAKVGSRPSRSNQPNGFSRRHPHTIGSWQANNTIYSGPGEQSFIAYPELRLSSPGGLVSHWLIPPWLKEVGLTYHRNETRWRDDGILRTVGRGQEFIANVDGHAEAKAWLLDKLKLIKQGSCVSKA